MVAVSYFETLIVVRQFKNLWKDLAKDLAQCNVSLHGWAAASTEVLQGLEEQ